MARLVRLTRMSMQKVHATSGADAEIEAARMVGDKHRALTLLMARYGAGIYRFAMAMARDHNLANLHPGALR